MWNLKYKDVPLNARKDCSVSSDRGQEFCDVELLKKEEYTEPKYATLEKNFWALDGTFTTLDAGNEGIAFCSKEMSDGEGKFCYSPTIVRTYGNYYSSVGISLQFDVNSSEYPKEFIITWYSDDVMISSKTFEADAVEYFAENVVENYNKIEITFVSTHIPYRYIKITRIEDGLLRTIHASELTKLNLLEEISDDCSELSVNTLTFGVIVKDVNYLFQKSQPIDLYKGDKLYSSFFLKSSTRDNKHMYNVVCEDPVGFLDSIMYLGGMYGMYFEGEYAEGITFEELITDIMKDEYFNFEIADDLKQKVIYGYLPYVSKRKALQQACMAVGAVCDPARHSVIRFYSADSDVNEDVYIQNENIIKGGKIITGEYITKLNISEHSYEASEASETVYRGKVPQGVQTLIFKKPVVLESVKTNLEEYEEGTAEIIKISYNYMIVNCHSDKFRLKVDANVYEDVPYVRTFIPDKLPYGCADKELSITDATLITEENIDEVAERQLNICKNNKTFETDLIVDNNKCGDNVIMNTEWEGQKKMKILKIDADIKTHMYAKAVLRING